MKFPKLEVILKNSPEQVKAAFLEKQLEPYFRESGFFTPGSAVKHIRWRSDSDGNLVGKLSYLRNRNLCVFRFHVKLEPDGHGTKAIIYAGHGLFSRFLIFLTDLVGICIALIGVVFAIIIEKAMQKGLNNGIEFLARNLSMWDSPVQQEQAV